MVPRLSSLKAPRGRLKLQILRNYLRPSKSISRDGFWETGNLHFQKFPLPVAVGSYSALKDQNHSAVVTFVFILVIFFFFFFGEMLQENNPPKACFLQMEGILVSFQGYCQILY